eukprot:gene12844-17218_t
MKELQIQHTITYPSYGHITFQPLEIEFIGDKNLFSVCNESLFSVKGLHESRIASNSKIINSLGKAIEPSSWFYSITPIYQPNEQYLIPSYGYIEFVLNSTDILENRRFNHHLNQNNTFHKSYSNHNVFSNNRNDIIINTNEILNICIWGSNQVDGQKKIWFQQIEHMNPSHFRFSWTLSLLDGLKISDLKQQYDRKLSSDRRANVFDYLQMFENVQVVDSPYNGYLLNLEYLEQTTDDGYPTAAEMWDGKEDNIYRYAHHRFLLSNFTIESIQPQWCRDMYILMRDYLESTHCDVVTFGNSRGFSSDVLITDSTRIMGIPTIAELLNLYTDPNVLPNIIVSPSTYAIEHESISNIKHFSHLPNFHLPEFVIISPSVDTSRFDLNNVVAPMRHPLSCSTTACVNIGFMARLSPGKLYDYTADNNNNYDYVINYGLSYLIEKNPGLMLQAAAEILKSYPHARFSIIGDGVLLHDLKLLCDKLGISWAVHFFGWVVEDLPQVLAGLDVMINPSLRGWSETFCISNIESMSMRIPLVTFGVG